MFENIQLPDSIVDINGSQGFVQYSIKPEANLLLPVVVSNEANIFFDSNFPVLTNTVWNTLVSDLYVGTLPVEGSDESIIAVPNPFSNQTKLILSESFSGKESTFILMNAMGKMVDSRIVNASEILITKENLKAGIYFFELRSKEGIRATGKLIME